MHTFVDCFSGAGGITCGFQMTERWKSRCGFDFEKTATDTYAHNFQVPARCCDLSDADTQKAIVDEFGGSVDALVGGPPCQGFSRRNGKRFTEKYDDMKKLPFAFVDIGLRLGVNVIVMEEVPQAASQVLPDIVARLNAEGFVCVWRILNAVEYRVPQNRRRLIMVATRNGWTFEWPEVSRERVSMRVAFKAADAPHGAVVSDYCRQRIETVRDSQQRLIGGNYAIMDLDSPSPTVHTKSIPGAGPYAIERDGVFHSLGVSEAATLQSFPSSFEFIAAETKQRKLIGNSVPPLLAKAIASGLIPPAH